jgi:bacillithiol biosynthesis cysteine-adding enzyme BshC
MTSIDFRELPLSADGFSKLFHDYIYNFSKIRHLYAGDFHSLENIAPHVERVRKPAEHRQILCDILGEQNRQLGCSEQTIRSIELLRNENTFCIVTGQQVGILGGPLYTIYKIFTAIKLAKHLNEKFSEYKFLPVFWLEGEDHDFAEVNHVTLLNQDNLPSKIEYLIDGKLPDKNLGAVGELLLDNALESSLSQLEKVLPHTEFRSSLLTTIRQSYAAGKTFNQAFAQWISYFIGEDALIFISSNDKRIKQILSPIFLKELQEFPRVSQLVIDQSAVLEKEYHAQIKPKAINLFLFYKGGRYLIEPRENDLSLKGTRYFPTRDELLSIAGETPEMLSPNVVLRTICQDTLLPTAIYVAGPSEIAYFAQLKPVYEYFGVPMPIIYPRASVTIVEQKLQSVLEKYELQLVYFFGNRKKLNDRVIDLLSEVNLDTLFSHAKQRIEELAGELKFGLDYIDTTLTGALETTSSKIESQLHVLKEKAAAAQRRKHEVALQQIDKVLNNVFPNGNYQERELNILHFMNKYGMDFPQRVYNEIKFDLFAHQVIML